MHAERLTNSTGNSVEALVTRIAKQRARLAQGRSFTTIRDIAQKLGLARIAEKQVVVGGTNGKGSTVGYLQQILSQQGIRVGSTTSPHLHSYLERITLNGVNVDARQCTDAICQIAEATSTIPMTYFDLTTLAALSLFRQWEVEVAVIEVGLGGRLDCANVVNSDVAVITNVNLDHTALLGNSIEEISREKVEIARPDKPLVFAEDHDNFVINAYVEKHASPFFQYRREFGLSSESKVFVTRDNTRQTFSIPSAINYATESFSTALQVASLLGLVPSDECLREMRFSSPLGRLEEGYTRDRHWVLDVAHNPSAVRYLLHALGRQNLAECVVIFACFSNKDVDGMLAALLDPQDGVGTNVVGVVITDSHGARALSASRAHEYVQRNRCVVRVEAALTNALSAAESLSSPEIPIVVLGSFDIVARAREALAMDEIENGRM